MEKVVDDVAVVASSAVAVAFTSAITSSFTITSTSTSFDSTTIQP